MKIIGIESLVAAKACGEQVEIARKQWPNGIPVSIESLNIATELGLNVLWCVDNYLPSELKEACSRACRPHRKAYERARKTTLVKILESF